MEHKSLQLNSIYTWILLLIVLALSDLAFSAKIIPTANISSLKPIYVNYKDIKALKNCAPRDTCFPAKFTDWNDDNYHSGNDSSVNDWGLRNCFCDSQCSVYEDCCADSPYAKLADVDIHVPRNGSFHCVHVSGLISKFYMKTTCSPAFQNSEVRNACEETSSEDPISSLPITNAISGITFKNYYCAICNNQSISNEMKMWEPLLKCFDTSHYDGFDFKKEIAENGFELRKDNQSWGFTTWSGENMIGSGCTISPIAPNQIKPKLRFCNAYIISSCPIGYKNIEIHRKCLSYTAVVYRTIEGYRNVHCALCNGLRLRDLDCRPHYIDQLIPTPAFSILFDLNSGTGNDVGRVDKCTVEQIYDPFSKKCRIILCTAGKVYQDGKCITAAITTAKPTEITGPDKITNIASNNTEITPGVRHRKLKGLGIKMQNANVSVNNQSTYTNNTSNISSTNTTTNEFETCPRILLSSTEYEIVNNETIFYRATGKNLSKVEFELYGESQVIVCSPSTKHYTEKFGDTLGYLTTLGLSVSIIFLLVHLIVFMIVPDLRNLSGKCVASLCIALLAIYCAFFTIPLVDIPSKLCSCLAVVLYYSFMSAFSWMFVLALDVTLAFRRTTKELRVSSGPQWLRFVCYSLFAWGFPVFLTSIATLIDFVHSEEISPAYVPNFGKHNCWFGQRKALLIYFITPIGLILLVNSILFFVTATIISSTAKGTANIKKNCGPSKQNFKSYLRLAVLMGISWIMGIIAGFIDNSVLWVVFIMLNTLQGLFIFIAFTCTSKIRKVLRKKVESSSLYINTWVSSYLLRNNDSTTTTTAT